MPAYPLTALVLRKTKLGETDTILTLMAADGTQVRAVAKGLRKPGSRFGARLEPFSVVDLLLHTGRSLDVITEARTVASHASLREDIDRSAAAAVIADVLDKISVEGQSEPRLFGLATATLDALESATSDASRALVVGFLVKAMAMHGYRPELESCAACASAAVFGGAFSLVHGGVLCPACGEIEPAALAFPEQARGWLAYLLGSTMAAIAAQPPPPAATGDCFELMRRFIAHHLPARLRALDYYAGLMG